jgi:hypothetical protein
MNLVSVSKDDDQSSIFVEFHEPINALKPCVALKNSSIETRHEGFQPRRFTFSLLSKLFSSCFQRFNFFLLSLMKNATLSLYLWRFNTWRESDGDGIRKNKTYSSASFGIILLISSSNLSLLCFAAATSLVEKWSKWREFWDWTTIWYYWKPCVRRLHRINIVRLKFIVQLIENSQHAFLSALDWAFPVEMLLSSWSWRPYFSALL